MRRKHSTAYRKHVEQEKRNTVNFQVLTLAWLYIVYVMTHVAGLNIEDYIDQPELDLISMPILIWFCFASLSILSYFDDLEFSF